MVGKIGIGADNPVRVQSMTNTPTSDYGATAHQIIELHEAGSELVRFTVMDDAYAQAIPKIKNILEEEGYGCIPLVGDFHFNGHLLLKRHPDCAQTLDKYRINPGNVGFGTRHDENFKLMIGCAIDNRKPVRIGVNAGSLDQEVLSRLMDENTKKPAAERKSADAILVDAMVASAIESAKKAEQFGFGKSRLVLSVKVSNVPQMVASYRMLAEKTDYALHLGLTEAGIGAKGTISSAAALSGLLQQGIGDTIRVSLTPTPESSRTEEVKAAQQILQANGIRSFMPQVTSCPGCGRTSSTLFQSIAKEISAYLQAMAPEWKKAGYSGFESMTVAVMGCVVNGPGESRHANIGLSLPGVGEDPLSPVFVDGRPYARLRGESRIADFKKMIDAYVKEHYQAELQNGNNSLS